MQILQKYLCLIEHERSRGHFWRISVPELAVVHPEVCTPDYLFILWFPLVHQHDMLWTFLITKKCYLAKYFALLKVESIIKVIKIFTLSFPGGQTRWLMSCSDDKAPEQPHGSLFKAGINDLKEAILLPCWY